MKKFLLTAGLLAVVGLAGVAEAAAEQRHLLRSVGADELAKIDADFPAACRKIVAVAGPFKPTMGTDWPAWAFEQYKKANDGTAELVAAFNTMSADAQSEFGKDVEAFKLSAKDLAADWKDQLLADAGVFSGAVVGAHRPIAIQALHDSFSTDVKAIMNKEAFDLRITGDVDAGLVLRAPETAVGHFARELYASAILNAAGRALITEVEFVAAGAITALNLKTLNRGEIDAALDAVIDTPKVRQPLFNGLPLVARTLLKDVAALNTVKRGDDAADAASKVITAVATAQATAIKTAVDTTIHGLIDGMFGDLAGFVTHLSTAGVYNPGLDVTVEADVKALLNAVPGLTEAQFIGTAASLDDANQTLAIPALIEGGFFTEEEEAAHGHLDTLMTLLEQGTMAVDAANPIVKAPGFFTLNKAKQVLLTLTSKYVGRPEGMLALAFAKPKFKADVLSNTPDSRLKTQNHLLSQIIA